MILVMLALAALALAVLTSAVMLCYLRAGWRVVREREAVMFAWAASLDKRHWDLWRREQSLQWGEGGLR